MQHILGRVWRWRASIFTSYNRKQLAFKRIVISNIAALYTNEYTNVDLLHSLHVGSISTMGKPLPLELYPYLITPPTAINFSLDNLLLQAQIGFDALRQ